MGEKRSGGNWSKPKGESGEEALKPTLEDLDVHEEKSSQKEGGIRDFYFTILNFNKGIEKKVGESDDAFEKRKARRQKQFEVAVASIQEKLGVDVTLPGGLDQAKAAVKAEFAESVRGVVPRERAHAQKKLLRISGIHASEIGYEDPEEVPRETPEVKRIGLAKLVAKGDAEAGLRLLGLRYDLSQKEAGWIKSIADRDRIVPLIELVLDNDTDAAKARERLSAFYKISGSDEHLEQILLEKEGSAADAEENLERLFGLAGAAEILKQIEKL